MSRYFTIEGEMFVETCCNCGIAFAMTAELHRRRLEDKGSFWCPNGHPQHYVGKTKAQKLADELRRSQRERDEMARRAREQEQRATRISRSYQRVRERVKNGVCPCCNRTFENLARHMATKHPDYGTHDRLRMVRTAYGLTQAQLAEEVGVPVGYISRFERGMELPGKAEAKLHEWVDEQSA